MECSPYLRRPLRSHAEAVTDISRRRDAQPDIAFQGNNLRRGHFRAKCNVSFITRQIAAANAEIRHLTDCRAKAQRRMWIAAAQVMRRKALQTLRMYDAVMKES